jgi:leader peptidase (prepilin peptidase)/N-methyltransferase
VLRRARVRPRDTLPGVEAVEVALLALGGLLLGSFASAVAHRIPIGENWVSGRSMCPDCGHQLASYDNIPVVSWVLLRGRCRYCGERISARYPLAELGLAAAFAGCYFRFEDDWALIAMGCVFCLTLLVITLTDLDHRIIPNQVLLASLAAGVVLSVLADAGDLDERAIAAAVAFAVLFLVALAYPSGMGMGDVKLAGLMGVYLGRAVAPALLVGFLVGAIFGLALIAKNGAEARKQAVPFGPFLAFGGLVGLFAGDEIVDWYLDTFFES